ncbi:MAG: threonine ammonia-lyase [Sphingomonadales bacterium]|nr:threonine ammonia-lyase [Sphingomonadales bacterium]PIX66042.1 MAG: threonine ammonia-lyase [Sphingomonadales bacterium CG_4_10_14_3_um_filter_58_15]NCO50281.1 threonine ammonia-lyase [Sphingomonadales bacterium]NCP01537.1 threonine ammonia-lyase [Sphingomonadales bacterium]NCP26746.1 threonine ammonia-lyase [Sphingomonadales bacterium]
MNDIQTIALPSFDFDDVKAAHDRIKDRVVHTPTLKSITLSEMSGAEVFLKFENLQFTAAYKERGALNALLLMDESKRKAGVIAASAGNHAQGLAYNAKNLDIPATIVMPSTTPMVKVEQTRGHGAEIVIFGSNYDEAYAHAMLLSAQRGLTYIHAFDDPRVAAGQGTVAIEMLEAIPDLDRLIIPIGGGGLFSGMATAAAAIKPGIQMTGVQAALYPSMYAKLNGKTMAAGGDTLAEGIAVQNPSEFTAAIIKKHVDEILLVSEAELEGAVSLLLQIEKTVVEGAGAAGLAALLSNKEKFAGEKVGLVLCGGNIDTRLLANVLLRDLARSGRLARLRLHLRDQPGALYNVVKQFAEHEVNIIEVYHQRVFTNLPAKGLITDIECEAKDREQLEGLIADLNKVGYDVRQVELAD